MTLILPSTKISPADTLFLFRASDCIDEEGIFARSYGRRLGGVFTRGSRKVVADSRGALVRLPNGAPPLAWIGGEPVMVLEQGRTNLCLRSEDFGTSWGTAGTTSRVAAAHVASGVSLDLLGDTDAAALSNFAQAISFTGDGTKAFSIFIKKGSAGSVTVKIRSIGVADRGRLLITWSGDVPSVAVSAGATYCGYEVLNDGVYRLLASAAGVVASESNSFQVYPASDTDVALTGTVYAGGAQAEDAVVPSSYIRTEGTTVTRSADSLNFPFSAPPRAMTVYVRGYHLGALSPNTGVSRRFLTIGTSAGARFQMIGSSADNALGINHIASAGSVASYVGGPTVVPYGALMEVRGVLRSDGAVLAARAIDGAAETAGAVSGGVVMNPAWGEPKMHLAGLSSGVAHAPSHVLAAAGERSLDEMRALAGV